MLILVIDDDELSRELLTLLLEVEGFTVFSAASGTEGLARLDEMDPQPEVVLSDLQMPGISGTALANAMKAALRTVVPVIAMSGSDSRPAGTPAGVPAGFDGFLLKPFTVADLREVIAAANRGDGGGTGEGKLRPTSVVATKGETDSPALNEEVFLKMQELMPAAQLGQMYALCIADARTRLAAMRALAIAGEDADYRREAHAIKGGAGMIGAAELYKLAEQSERDGLDVSVGTSSVTALLGRLSRACERLERILVERLQS